MPKRFLLSTLVDGLVHTKLASEELDVKNIWAERDSGNSTATFAVVYQLADVVLLPVGGIKFHRISKGDRGHAHLTPGE